ncbi:DNA adenine methyltransferase (DNA methylase) from phage origin, partial [Escherichia coli O104:H4 str. LB226692]
LYLFCGHRLASDIEIMMRERFSVLNHIIWAKPSGRWNGCNKESLRVPLEGQFPEFRNWLNQGP